MSVLSPSAAQIRPIESDEVKLDGGVHSFVPVLVSAPFESFNNGRCEVQLQVTDSSGDQRVLTYMLLGPINLTPAHKCVGSDHGEYHESTTYQRRSTASRPAERLACFQWTSFILLLLGGSVGMWIYAAVLAVSDPSMAVVPDYHEKALQWDKHLEVQRASQAVVGRSPWYQLGQ